ncbi:hypothetical protein L9Z41_16845 [Leptospira noguchii]|uniref:hypothetical protein n=1 Tax=Leptospira noguchii TaxID=28182 RepID=UPI001F066DD2|nr:hypothetical protein [Leptospira noguchii]MCH1910653.1 hypothetical protein [Leptospira noguchii]MCH1911761.1 hypothetical protein [Leptospira noguchii]MCH1913088.1 hypothetical protein [Leptospira noguchii]MCH1913757.1 hypothetical protein [Leptospira noguchii]MCH1914073.1 hypothetical protein [Leptospira noguchii]
MSLTGVADSLKDFSRPIQFFRKLPKATNARGESIREFATGIPLTWPVTTISSKQLYVLPDGQYTSEDRNFYQIGKAIQVNVGDEFEFEGVRYIVSITKDLNFEAGFVRYVCKKKVSNS